MARYVALDQQFLMLISLACCGRHLSDKTKVAFFADMLSRTITTAEHWRRSARAPSWTALSGKADK
ncbi:MAG TPA: hypothetical protein VF649_03125 [Sphingomonas sp.]|jgi:hypothetical protein|uniref:hypothetical protein n=1 Tax=Sphingomonas sp. TaxID=28214 RepID=UPI002ED9750B